MSYVSADERRRQLIEAAITVIARDGLAKATTRRIAEEADAALASLHYTFRSKEELFTAVYQEWIDQAADRFAGLVPEGSGLEVGVRNLLTGFFDEFEANTPEGIAQYEIFFWALRTPSARSLATDIYENYFSVCVQALDRAADGEADGETLDELASFVCGALDGILIKFLAFGHADAVRKDLERYITLGAAMANRDRGSQKKPRPRAAKRAK